MPVTLTPVMNALPQADHRPPYALSHRIPSRAALSPPPVVSCLTTIRLRSPTRLLLLLCLTWSSFNYVAPPILRSTRLSTGLSPPSDFTVARAVTP